MRDGFPSKYLLAAYIYALAMFAATLMPDMAVACTGHNGNRAVLANCGGGGGGRIGGGGGGGNYGAAIGAAGAALGILGDVLSNSGNDDGGPEPSAAPTRSCRPGLTRTRDGYCVPRGVA